MAKKIDPNESLTRLELDIVFMRYFEGLCNPEVAERLGLQLNQVEYRINKPKVKQYIREEVLPHTQKQLTVKLNTANINPTIGAKLFYFAIFMRFVFLAVVCIKLYL